MEFANILSFLDLFFGLYGLESIPWIDQSRVKKFMFFFSIQDHNKAMEAAQQQKAAAAANGGRAASGQPQMRDSPNDNRGGSFFHHVKDFDKKISNWGPDHKNSIDFYMTHYLDRQK